MTDLRPHAALSTTQLAAPLARLLNAHIPALPFLEVFSLPADAARVEIFNSVLYKPTGTVLRPAQLFKEQHEPLSQPGFVRSQSFARLSGNDDVRRSD